MYLPDLKNFQKVKKWVPKVLKTAAGLATTANECM